VSRGGGGSGAWSLGLGGVLEDLEGLGDDVESGIWNLYRSSSGDSGRLGYAIWRIVITQLDTSSPSPTLFLNQSTHSSSMQGQDHTNTN
jgi:hypothetical protein